ncbi:DNA recombination protein RmuC [Thermodesulfatator autotrophicus]|uniref:DNA recombination protein RmuC n=1 Tax=Thermodesulfatator autotrophicus TaxID=1795632 RepID=A0A177E6I5_9BACT|nr:DNA recombination protein RmuC [Thermodesulfatator autotrophicus]OAG27573.1 hypothetical protein TH606_06305 [Thermodesulfatator autotrophicus]
MWEILLGLGGLAIGFGLAWVVRQKEINLLEEQLQDLKSEKEKLSQEIVKHINESLNGLSGQIVEKNAQILGHLTREIFEAREKHLEKLTLPLHENLQRLEEEIKRLENQRARTYGQLEERLKTLVEEHLPRLEKETSMLKGIFQNPQQRGHWGEIQLKRLVELAGLVEHCDFSSQVTTDKGLRPDLVIHLPGEKVLAVDAKAPVFNQDKNIARIIKEHIKGLSQKAYWEALRREFKRTPDFVILFLPAESLLSAAYKEDPTIFEFAARRKVILATPFSLLAMLKAVAVSWQETALIENAQELIQAAREMYSRLEKVSKHLEDLGKSLEKTTIQYNQLLGSFERRLLPFARKFEKFSLTPKKKTFFRPYEGGRKVKEEPAYPE